MVKGWYVLGLTWFSQVSCNNKWCSWAFSTWKMYTESEHFVLQCYIWELVRLMPNALPFLYLFLFEMQVHKHMKSYVVCWTTFIWWRESNRLPHLHKQVAWRDSIQFWIILLRKWLPFPMLECTAGIIMLSFRSQYPILQWILEILVVGSTQLYIVETIVCLCIAHFPSSYTNSR